MKVKDQLLEWLGYGPHREPESISAKDPTAVDKVRKDFNKVSPARSTEAPQDTSGWSFLDENKRLVEPGYQYEIIPVMRKLSINNANISQAVKNYVALANTGHELVFDAGVSADQIQRMAEHLETVEEQWHYGSAGMHGIINRLITQALIAGCVSAEAVPKKDLSGVSRVAFPLPETIRFVYNETSETYEPHQVVKKVDSKNPLPNGLKPLNTNTYKYFAINGDTEIPYGNPPYLPALEPLIDQKKMLENIQFIISQMGVMGFLELLVEKPEQRDGETDTQYAGRLETYLAQCKNATQSGMRDGMMVGYQDDHEFKFHSASATASGVSEIYDQNEKRVFSGVGQDPAISGRSMDGGGETNITIVFTKLLSELTNIQLIVAKVVQHIYNMELRLAGFSYKSFKVEMNSSTIQDDLKFEQAQEIKIRNARQLRVDGIITQDQYAKKVGESKPAQQEPVVPFLIEKPGTGDPTLDAEKKKVREKSKDASDRKVRDKNKPQGTIKK